MACKWTVEYRTSHRHDPIAGMVPVRHVRFVCTCGHATNWYVDEHRATADTARHAVGGQQTLAL